MIHAPEVLEKMHNFSKKPKKSLNQKVSITKLKLKVQNTEIKPLLKP